jgi:hypothetical protein
MATAAMTPSTSTTINARNHSADKMPRRSSSYESRSFKSWFAMRDILA